MSLNARFPPPPENSGRFEALKHTAKLTELINKFVNFSIAFIKALVKFSLTISRSRNAGRSNPISEKHRRSCNIVSIS